MKLVYRKISDIKPHERNPRKNECAVVPVAESIKQFGFQQPIVIDVKNEIIAGHTRYEAAKHLELKEVPCIVAEKLTPKQIKAYRLADNKTHELSVWDHNLLDEILVELLNDDLGFDMSDFGFDMKHLEFEPVSQDEQPHIDSKKKELLTCPHCGGQFEK